METRIWRACREDSTISHDGDVVQIRADQGFGPEAGKSIIPERVYGKVTVENGIDGYIPVAMIHGTKLDYTHSIMIKTSGRSCLPEHNRR